MRSDRAQSGKLRTSMTRFFELPSDVVLDLPRLTLVGGVELELENHRGLVRCETDLIVIAFRGGEMDVRGDDLRVVRLDRDVLVLGGRVTSVEIRDDRGDEQ